MQKSNLADVCQIADICHPNFPEDTDVLAEKQKLSPHTCFVLKSKKAIACGVAGYVLAHPYKLFQIPPLNHLLGEIPKNSDTLYLHDMAILPNYRLKGAGQKALALLMKCAKENKFSTISLVAVNGSAPYWQKYGFTVNKTDNTLKQKLLTYGADALYMLLNVA